MNWLGRQIALMLGDILIFASALFVTLTFRYLEFPSTEFFELHFFPFSFIFFIWIIIFYIAGLYSREFLLRKTSLTPLLFRTQVTASALAALFFYLLPVFEITPRANLFLNLVVTFLFLWGWRSFAAIFFRAKAERIFLAAQGSEVEKFRREVESHSSYGFDIAVYATPEEFEKKFASWPEEEFFNFLKTKDISFLLVDFATLSSSRGAEILYHSLARGLIIFDFKEMYESMFDKVPLSLLTEEWLFHNMRAARKSVYSFLKRILDILVAIPGTILTLLLLPWMALLIILSRPSDLWHYRKRRARPGDGLIFFRQKRVGKDGKVFDFIKFRSQILGAEKMSHKKDAEKDERQYFIGTLLRKTYLDELPQIWNVLKGEMSFVGPRPERPEYVEELRKKIPYYEMRFLVPPGITGWAQINMENDASVEDAPEKILYDLYYIKNLSLFLDLRIMLKTIATILSRSGR